MSKHLSTHLRSKCNECLYSGHKSVLCGSPQFLIGLLQILSIRNSFNKSHINCLHPARTALVCSASTPGETSVRRMGILATASASGTVMPGQVNFKNGPYPPVIMCQFVNNLYAVRDSLLSGASLFWSLQSLPLLAQC